MLTIIVQQLLLLAGLGEFLEANIAAIISGFVGFFGGAIAATFWLARLEGKVRELDSRVKEVETLTDNTATQFNLHLRDSDAHVNKPYISGLEKRIDKVEQAVSSGHLQINNKLDTLLVANGIHNTRG